MTVKSIILTSLLATGCTAAWGGETVTPASSSPTATQNCVSFMSVEQLEKIFSDALAEMDRKPETDAALAFALMRDCLMYRRGANEEERVVLAEAVITLWRGDHQDTLQLAWWRARSSYARLFILVVELGSRSREGLLTSGCPYFDSHRFAEDEREIRQAEYDWVMANHAAIRAMLGRLNLLLTNGK